MRELRECSGPWAGQWIQGDVRGTMRMRLAFDGDGITGYGADGDGPFSLRGHYVQEESFVILDKSYSELNVRYRGEWDGQMISGVSTITGEGFFDTGEFEIWPESDEEALRMSRAETASRGIPGRTPDDFGNSVLPWTRPYV